MVKIIKTFSAILIFLSVISCEKDKNYTVHNRKPNPVEFVPRELSTDLVIGARKPATLEVVDLGLSVKWTNLNLGAESSTVPGDFFAWGEINPSNNYSWANYEFNDPQANDKYTLYLTKYCYDRYGENQDLNSRSGNTLHKYDDAAYIYYGEGYRIPTGEELKELYEKCTWNIEEDENVKNQYIYTVTGPNNNSIQITICGVGIGTTIDYQNPNILPGLWSSSLSSMESPFAEALILSEKTVNFSTTGMNRCFGLNIRAVYTK